MNTISFNQNNIYNRTSFGMRVESNGSLNNLKTVLNGFSTERTDQFIKSLEDSEIGGDKESLNIVFKPMFIKDDIPVVGYSFYRKGKWEPRTVHYCTYINGHENMEKDILNDAERYVNGVDNERISMREFDAFLHENKWTESDFELGIEKSGMTDDEVIETLVEKGIILKNKS